MQQLLLLLPGVVVQRASAAAACRRCLLPLPAATAAAAAAKHAAHPPSRPRRYNAANRMLEVASPGSEAELGVNFAQLYRESELARCGGSQASWRGRAVREGAGLRHALCQSCRAPAALSSCEPILTRPPARPCNAGRCAA